MMITEKDYIRKYQVGQNKNITAGHQVDAIL